MSRRPETGASALMMLVAPQGVARSGARGGLRALLLAHRGSYTAAAAALGVGRAAVAALIGALDLSAWVDATWPGHRAGGGDRRSVKHTSEM